MMCGTRKAMRMLQASPLTEVGRKRNYDHAAVSRNDESWGS